MCTLNMLFFVGFTTFVFTSSLNAFNIIDVYAPKGVLISCFPLYFSKFLLNDVHNIGVDVIIYVGNLVIFHKP